MTRTLEEWAAVAGIKATTLRYRLLRGVPIEVALQTAPQRGKCLPAAS